MITVADAAAVYPELGRLYTVLIQRSPDWVFVPLIKDGQLDALQGARFWPDGHVDRFGIKSQTNAGACRLDPAKDMVWFAHGTVGDVVDRILEELAPPHHPAAPRRPEPRVIVAVGLVTLAPRVSLA